MTGPNILRYKKAEDCPNAANHTPCPKGYLQWHSWAADMSRSHRQRKCTTCGFYAMWILK